MHKEVIPISHDVGMEWFSSGGGGQFSSSIAPYESFKDFLSMAKLVSIVCASLLATVANADFTDNQCSSTSKDCTINSNVADVVKNNATGDAKLTIQKSGAITGIENQGSLTVINSGTIKANNIAVVSDFSQNIKMDITNESGALIEGKGGIEIGKKNKVTNATITLINKGEIKGSETQFTPGNNIVDAYGMSVVNDKNGMSSGAITIEKIDNSGLIQSGEYGLNFVGNGGSITIKSLKNSGTIKGGNTGHDGIHLGRNTATEELENTGTIQGKFAMWLADNADIKSFKNVGTIEGLDRGVVVAGHSVVASLINTGTIQGNGKAGIQIQNNATIKSLQVESNGKISGVNGGIFVESGGTLETLNAKDSANISSVVNNGSITTIEASGNVSIAAINNAANAKITTINVSGSAEITAITNASGASIQNLELSNQAKISTITNEGSIKQLTTKDSGEIGKLENKSGATIDTLDLVSDIKDFKNDGEITTIRSETAKLDKFTNTGNVSNFINVKNINTFQNDRDLKTLTNDGMITGGIINKAGGNIAELKNTGKVEQGIKNQAIITKLENANSGTITGGIDNSATIDKLENMGTIEGGVKNSSTLKALNNTGIIKVNANGRHLENTLAGATIKIENWYVPSFGNYISLLLHNDLGSIKDQGDSRVVLGGAGAGDVDFSDATLLIDAKDYEQNVYFDVGNTILIRNSPYRSAGAFPKAIEDYGKTGAFTIVYDRATGKFIINPRAAVMAGGFFADYLINYLQRRNISINQLVRYEEEKLRYGEGDIGHIFVIPYRTYDNFDLTSRSGEAKIKTNGLLGGWHAFSDYGIFGGFMGYESSRGDIYIKDSDAYSDVTGDIDGFFAGLRHRAYLWENGGHKLSWSNQAKFSQKNADLAKTLNGESFKATVNLLNFVADSTLNYDYSLVSSLGKSVMSLSSALVYDGVRVNAFKLSTTSQKRSEDIYGADLALRFSQQYKNVSGAVEVGAHRLFNNTIKAYYNDNEDSFKIPRNYQFLQTGLTFDVAKNTYFSVNYSALFASNGTSHLGSLTFNVVW